MMEKFTACTVFLSLLGHAAGQPEFIAICEGVEGYSPFRDVGGVLTGSTGVHEIPKHCWNETRQGFVYCLNTNLTAIPPDLPLSTTCLVIEGGNINSVEASAINYLPNLQVLGLFGSGVQTVVGSFTHPQLHVLAITGGGLKSIPSFTNGRLTKLILRSNEIRDVDLAPIARNPVKELDLSQNPFTDFPTSSLSLVGNSLTNLSVRPSEVEFIDASSLRTIPNVQNLQIAAYTIKADAFLRISPRLNVNTFAFSTCVIESFALRGLRLTSLKLGHTHACKEPSQGLTIQPNSFNGMTELENLDLDFTQLSVIPKDVFQGLPALNKSLLIAFNRVNDIEEGALDGLSQVRQLRLTNNQGTVTNIPDNIFSSAGLNNLDLLDLSSFNVEFVPDNMFQNLPDLLYLYLGYNRVQRMNEAALKPVLPHLKNLTLYENPWLCDCKLRWLRELLDKKRDIFDAETLYLWKCEAPQHLKGKLFALISPSEFVC